MSPFSWKVVYKLYLPICSASMDCQELQGSSINCIGILNLVFSSLNLAIDPKNKVEYFSNN